MYKRQQLELLSEPAHSVLMHSRRVGDSTWNGPRVGSSRRCRVIFSSPVQSLRQANRQLVAADIDVVYEHMVLTVRLGME